MHIWRLQLLALLAVIHPIASFSHRSLVDGREQCCDRQDDLLRDSRHSYGTNRFSTFTGQDRRLDQRSESRERFYESRKNEPRLARLTDIRQMGNLSPANKEAAVSRISRSPVPERVGIHRSYSDNRLSRISRQEGDRRIARVDESYRIRTEFEGLGARQSVENRRLARDRVQVDSRVSRSPLRERQEVRRSLSDNRLSRTSQDDRRREFDRVLAFRDRTQNNQLHEIRNSFINKRSKISRDSRRENHRERDYSPKIERDNRESRNILGRTRIDVAQRSSFNDRSRSVEDRRMSRERVQDRRDVKRLEYRLDRQRGSLLERAREIRLASRFDAREIKSTDNRNIARDQMSLRTRSESRMGSDDRRHYNDNRQIRIISRVSSNEETRYRERRVARVDERFRTRNEFEGLRARQSLVEDRLAERIRTTIDERRAFRTESRKEFNRAQNRANERRGSRMEISRERMYNEARLTQERHESKDINRQSVDDRRILRERREIREVNRAVDRERLPYGERRVVRERNGRQESRFSRLNFGLLSKDRRFATEHAQRLSRSESRLMNRERLALDSRRLSEAEERYSRQESDRSRNSQLKRLERSITRRDVNNNDRRDLREKSTSRNSRENIRDVDRRHRSSDRLESRENMYRDRPTVQTHENQFMKQNREDYRIDLVEKARTRQNYLAMSRDTLIDQEAITFKWQYLLYTLQGIYLCSLLIQLMSAKEYQKKTRISQWWAMTSPALVHSKLD